MIPSVSMNMKYYLTPVFLVVMISAILIESDIYRYLTLFAVVVVSCKYRSELRQASNDWLAILCYTWAAYASIRFLSGIYLWGEKGTSEWLYIFPVFFPFLGVALYLSKTSIFHAATGLIIVGLFVLIQTIDFSTFASGLRAAPLLHHNPIHAGIGSGFLFLTSVFWIAQVSQSSKQTTTYKIISISIGTATAVLSLIGILGSQSKGAWLALAMTILVIFTLSLSRHRLHSGHKLRVIAFISVAICVGMVMLPYLWKVAGPTAISGASLINALMRENTLAVLRNAISNPLTPSSMAERLMLWHNALELFSRSPWVGWGNMWLSEWRHTTYADIKYKLIHNGYLEILVRHGLLGITFLLVFIAAALKTIKDAHRLNVSPSILNLYIISISTFFLGTIMTNSNNRLALGETFFLVVGGAIFAMRLAIKEKLKTQEAFGNITQK